MARATSIVAALSMIGLSSALVTLIPAAFTHAPAGAFTAPSEVTDVNPNSLTSGNLFGGRTVAFAVNPINTQIVFAATEFGGLWKSTDHGSSWSHVDQVPLTAMQDVQFAASDANLVIATGAYDGSIDNRGGGIWRSTDGGSTWAKVPSGDVCQLSGNSARKIGIGTGTPGSLPVFVATPCGLAQSTDSGATFSFNNAAGNNNFWDVKVRQVNGNTQVDACGSNGYSRSNDGGVTWPTITAFPSGGFIPCRLALAPQDPNTVFLTTRSPVNNPSDGIGETLQFESDDGGANFHNLNVSTDGNGRDPNVFAFPGFDGAANHIEVFFMTDSTTMHQQCDTNNAQRCADGNGANVACGQGGIASNAAWTQYDSGIPHCAQDPGDLAYDPGTKCPFLEGADGGIFQTTNGCTNTPTFTIANAGLHALWVYQIAGTAEPTAGTPHTDVYYGMQDNGQVCSNDDAATFHNCGGADVFNTLADLTGPPSSVLKDQNKGFNLFNEDGTTPASWTSPTGNLDKVAQFGNGSYAFITDDGKGNYQVQVTTNAGTKWTQMGQNLPGAPVGPIQNSSTSFVASGTQAAPVFYMELTVNNAPTIYRLSGPMDNTATLTQANNGLTTPGAFNVSPTDPTRLYAVDTGTQSAMFSTNGGQSWSADPNLTSVVTAGGVYPFVSGAGPNVASFGFDPASQTVVAGTNFSGIYSSTNGGANWSFVPGSQQIPRTRNFFFDTRNPGVVYVGSQGRGLWKITLPKADLSITKTHSPDPVIAGNQLTWHVSVKNNGPDPAPNVTVTDTLPVHDAYLTNNLNPPAGCTAVGQVVTCNLGDMDNLQTVNFDIVTLVDPNTVALAGGPTSITDTATVASSAVIDPNPANNTALDTAIVNDSADLAVSKLCKPDTTIYAGTPINCTVFVDNFGPSYARNVVVDDITLANGSFTITNVAVSPGPTNCGVSSVTGGQDLSCQVGNLAPASTTQTGRVTLSYTITATEGMNIDNTASVRSDTPDPNPANNTATVNLTVTALADLALTKSGPSSVVAGTPITWTLSVANKGPSTASNVAITDTVPAGVTITSASMSGASCTTGVAGDPTQPTVCTFGSLSPGATSSTMTVNATVNPRTTGILQNDARVSSDTFDNNASNNLANTETTVVVQSSLSVAIAATPNPVTAGTPLSYPITVSNAGPSTATGVTLTDPLPSGVTFSSTGGVGTCGFQTNTNTVTCQLPNLDPGQNDVVFIYTNVKPSTPPGPMANSATAMGSGSPNATGNVSTTVQTLADLAINLTSDTNVYHPSTTIHYQITVNNLGPSDAQHVVITQALPAVKQGKYISNSLGCPPPAGTTLTCSFASVPALVTVPAGGTISFQVNFFITGNKGLITSTASVTSATSDPVSSNNTSTRNVTVK
jgi:uncharacterized repeat protein (TIGR01451 family)